MSNEIEDEEGAYEWPEGKLGLQVSTLEESLLCPICQVILENPVIYLIFYGLIGLISKSSNVEMRALFLLYLHP